MKTIFDFSGSPLKNEKPPQRPGICRALGGVDRLRARALLRELQREQVCAIGRVAARHAIKDEILWDLAKELDWRYQRLRRRLARKQRAEPPVIRYLRPHPGLLFLLARLEREARADARGGTLA